VAYAMIRGLAGCHVVLCRLAVAILLAASSAGPVLAQTADPGRTEFAIDLQANAVVLDIRLNDIPLFGVEQPANPFPAQVLTTVPINSGLQPGRNVVTVRHSEVPDPVMEGMVVRLRFTHNEAGSYPAPFSGDVYALDLSIPGAEEQPFAVRLGETPFISVVERPEVVDAEGTIALTLDYAIDMPASAWPGGEVLEKDMATRVAVEGEMRRAHAAFAAGRDGVLGELRPMIDHLSASYGMTPEAFLDTLYAPFVDPSQGFALRPFDAEQARLELFGNGRLATLVPSPVVFENSELKETFAPDLFYWRDGSGTWRLID